MKRLVHILPVAALFFTSCLSFSVTKEVKINSRLNNLKNSGIIIRYPSNSRIHSERFNRSLKNWLAAYKKQNNLRVIEDAREELYLITDEFSRFYQISADGYFMPYKTIGILTTYLNEHNEEIKRIFDTYTLDSLIIYEVDGAFSPEMEFIDFNSTLVIINREMKLAYLDHQFDNYNTHESDPDVLKKYLLDKVNLRFIETMLKLDFLEER